MSDSKISNLTAATTPLAGTEVLPIVQSGATKKVATDDLTVKNLRSNATTGILQVAGPAAASTRVMTTPDANFTVARTDAAQSFTGDQTLSTGNLVIGTSGKGIDFSATTDGSGTMTSELLSDYEEGTWTPELASSGATFSHGAQYGIYTKVGRLVTATFRIYASASGTVTNGVTLESLPFTSAANYGMVYGGYIVFSNTSITPQVYLGTSSTSAYLGIAVSAADATPTSLGMDVGSKWLNGVIIYYS